MWRGAGVICLSGSKLLGNEPAIYLSDALLAIYKINGLVCALTKINIALLLSEIFISPLR